MERGVKFHIPDNCFPRFAFFKHHLKSALNRCGNILGKGKLTKYIYDGEKHMEMLRKGVADFDDGITVSLFDTERKVVQTDLVVKPPKAQISETQTTFTEFTKETKNVLFSCCRFTVFAIKDEQQLQEATRFHGLSTDQLDNIIFYNEATGSTHLYKDLVAGDFPTLPEGQGSQQHIGVTIQKRLEEKTVGLLEMLCNFVKDFVPQKKKHTDLCILEVLKNCFQKKWNENPFLEELVKQIRENGDSRAAFDEHVRDCCSGLVKHTIENEVAKRNGVSSAMVSEMLFDFGLNEKLLQRSSDETIEDFIVEGDDKLLGQRVRAEYRRYSIGYLKSTRELVNDVEEFIRDKMTFLDLMDKLEFELHGILRQSDVISVPGPPKLPEQLKTDLSGLEKVRGFAHIYDRLVIYMYKRDIEALSNDEKSQIEKLMKRHRYTLPYTFEPPLRFTLHVEVVKGQIEHGNKIKLQNESNEDVSATVGTFVEMKREAEGVDEMIGKLYAITCGHCVWDCKPEVQVARTANKFESFGKVMTEYTVFDKTQLERDVAFIEVDKDKIASCNTKVRKPTDLEPTSTWEVYERVECLKPGAPVFMIGSSSSVMEGVIVQADGMGEDLNNTIFVKPHADVSEDDDRNVFSKGGDSGSVVWFLHPEGAVFAIGLLCGSATKEKEEYSYVNQMKRLFEFIQDKFKCTIKPACKDDSPEQQAEATAEGSEYDAPSVNICNRTVPAQGSTPEDENQAQVTKDHSEHALCDNHTATASKEENENAEAAGRDDVSRLEGRETHEVEVEQADDVSAQPEPQGDIDSPPEVDLDGNKDVQLLPSQSDHRSMT